MSETHILHHTTEPTREPATVHHFDPDAHYAELLERSAMIGLVLDAANAEYPHENVPAWFEGPLPEFDSVEDEDTTPVRTYSRSFGPADAGWSVTVIVDEYARDRGLERSPVQVSMDVPDWLDLDSTRAVASALTAAADAVGRG
ncbi:hypothetical protein QYN14_05390 [Rhodococcus ruber]|uniref:hypothetical protein n=1 Tax=Rhodococcus ruber TaxID=1830 RepID=UPI0026594388|nr:hypothetical protein [Rhodococcus ruber]WKK13031.1 hypothetical protein QYN14_05390 [Rhodococcus ruber]